MTTYVASRPTELERRERIAEIHYEHRIRDERRQAIADVLAIADQVHYALGCCEVAP